MRFDLIVNTMYMKAHTEGTITINNAHIWRPVLGMNDAVAAYRLAVAAPRATSGIFNISSDNFTVGDVGKKVAEHFEKKHSKKLIVKIKNIPDKRNYKMSTDKAKKILGFAPQDTVETILEELDRHIGPDFDFSADRHYNILVFKKEIGTKKRV